MPRDLTAQQRWALALSVLVAHGVAAWLMANARPVEVVQERAPISVQLIAPPQSPPAAAPVSPPPPAPIPPKVAKPKAVLSTPAPSQNVLQAPPKPVVKPPVEASPQPVPPAPAAVATMPAPAASVAAAPAPAESQGPKQLSISAVRYAVPPVLAYPETSQRLGEQGEVVLSVLVDERGRPADVQVSKSSGFSRLDRAAVTAMRAARFVPYMEGGVPRAFRVPAPTNFNLSD